MRNRKIRAESIGAREWGKYCPVPVHQPMEDFKNQDISCRLEPSREAGQRHSTYLSMIACRDSPERLIGGARL